jgi:23S rRNA (uracil1939-C5)-methyltransferase
MVERVVIARLGQRGDGIAESRDGPLYVPYALPGETVEVEHRWPDRGHLIKIEVPSPERVAPICPHFGVCGGCALQHLAVAGYREWKRRLVTDALDRAGIDAPVDELVDAQGVGRRRAVFHARHGPGDVLFVGFSERMAHQIVAIDRCPILTPELDGAIETARDIAEALAGARKPLDIAVTATDTGLDIEVRGSGPLAPAQIAELGRLAERHRIARLTRHGEIVAQRAMPMVRIGPAQVGLPPGAFLQATAAGEAILASLVKLHCADAHKIADLFCGVGPFALRLAERARVIAMDSDAAAITALRRAAAVARGLKPIEAQQRDLFRNPCTPAELEQFDAVIFDPPRRGAEAQARALAASKVPIVVAVSCNPATFARDASTLIDAGYRLVRVTPVDQFVYSAHVELVSRFDRLSSLVRRSSSIHVASSALTRQQAG